jgi:hypothetical protein
MLIYNAGPDAIESIFGYVAPTRTYLPAVPNFRPR